MQTKPQTLEHRDLASEQLEDLPVADAEADQTTGGSGTGKREMEIHSWSFTVSNPS
jgi:hypothetical protein